MLEKYNLLLEAHEHLQVKYEDLQKVIDSIHCAMKKTKTIHPAAPLRDTHSIPTKEMKMRKLKANKKIVHQKLYHQQIQ